MREIYYTVVIRTTKWDRMV